MASNLRAQAVAKTYTHGSNRKVRDGVESKTVFKSVMENPFYIRWPIIPLNVQNAILARFILLLEGVAEYTISRREQSQKGKRKRRKERQAAERAKRKRKSEKTTINPGASGSTEVTDAMFAALAQKSNAQAADESSANANVCESVAMSDVAATTSGVGGVAVPEALSCLTIGINEVTKRLEQQCHPSSTVATSEPVVHPETNKSRSPLRIVLACRQDVDPPLLIAHIPQLVAACNSQRRGSDTPVKLVPLPKGSESALAQAMGLRRVTVAALEGPLAEDPALRTLLESVPAVIAPWSVGDAIETSASERNPIAGKKRSYRIKHVSTHIKQLRTTAPKDMRAAKVLRAKRRAEAKQKRRDKGKEGKSAKNNTKDGKASKVSAEKSNVST